jgi:hypothetical protein
MAITNSLTEIQRQQLLDILNKRFQKMTDGALLELERLTRHPMDLAGFQAKSNDIVVRPDIKIVKHQEKIPDYVTTKVFNSPLTRREFITCSATGLLGLLLCGTGYGWLSSSTSVEELSGKIEEVNSDITGLRDVVEDMENKAEKCDQEILFYLEVYPQTLKCIGELKSSLDKIQGLYSQFDETGMTIADAIQKIFDWISWYPDAEKFAQLISTMLDIVKSTPDIIVSAEKAITDLDNWFSNDSNHSLKDRVFYPTQSLIQDIENKINPKVQSIQANVTGV